MLVGVFGDFSVYFRLQIWNGAQTVATSDAKGCDPWTSHDFQRLLRAADFLRVHFYGKDAARLLGRGGAHLGWDHFAGMSYFSTDTVCFTHFKKLRLPGVTWSGSSGQQTSAAGDPRLQADLQLASTSAWNGNSTGDCTSVNGVVPRAFRPENFLHRQ